MTPQLPSALAAIADRLHALPGDAHRVSSPLGVWLLLATAARAGAEDEPMPGALEQALGMPRAEAVDTADRLIGSAHPAVRNAFAAWAREDLLPGPLGHFLDGLPGDVARGALPTQSEADAWAADRTDGLITACPVPITPSTVLTLANALACRVGWREPFRTTAAGTLGPGPFAERVERALTTTPGAGHGAWITDSLAGPVAVHVARAEGLDVWSVIADAAVAPRTVLAAAHALASGDQARIALSDLPLGPGPGWTIEQVRASVTPSERRAGRVASVTLPAWSASATFDLMADPGLAFPEAGAALGALVAMPGLDLVAAQSAMARYHRVGFEAAAVTAMAGRTSVTAAQDGPLRVARLRYAHPYAVLALARPTGPWSGERDPWDGIPVFSAWVAEPEEPED